MRPRPATASAWLGSRAVYGLGPVPASGRVEAAGAPDDGVARVRGAPQVGDRDVELGEHRAQQRQRQPGDVARVAVDAVDEPAAEPVEGERAGHPQRLAGGDVGVRSRRRSGCRTAPTSRPATATRRSARGWCRQLHQAVPGVQQPRPAAHPLPHGRPRRRRRPACRRPRRRARAPSRSRAPGWSDGARSPRQRQPVGHGLRLVLGEDQRELVGGPVTASSSTPLTTHLGVERRLPAAAPVGRARPRPGRAARAAVSAARRWRARRREPGRRRRSDHAASGTPTPTAGAAGAASGPGAAWPRRRRRAPRARRRRARRGPRAAAVGVGWARRRSQRDVPVLLRRPARPLGAQHPQRAHHLQPGRATARSRRRCSRARRRGRG